MKCIAILRYFTNILSKIELYTLIKKNFAYSFMIISNHYSNNFEILLLCFQAFIPIK